MWWIYPETIVEDRLDERDAIILHEPAAGPDHVARRLPIERLHDGDATFHSPAVLKALLGGGG